MDISKYDFIDIGCSSGGATDFAKNVFDGGSSLGIDNNANKVAQARAAGYEVIQADAVQACLFVGSVRFVIMSHFLEHLPDLETAEKVMSATCSCARDFVYIQQPWFDSDEMLADLGLKFCWSDWTGHPNHVRVADFVRLCEQLLQRQKAVRFVIWGHHLVRSSQEKFLLPLSASRDQTEWSPEKHGLKPDVSFEQEVFREIRVVGAIREPDVVEDVIARAKGTRILWDSAKQKRWRLKRAV